MTATRRHVLASFGVLATGIASPAIVRGAGRARLIVGTQDIAIQETVIASKVLDGISFDLQWAVLPGPAAQLSGLYSKALDVGLMGDTSLIIEQGRSKLEWTEENAPLQIVAGWRNVDRAYPPIVTVVRNDAKINGLEDLRGRKWAYNFGGFNYLQYVLSRLKAGLKANDIQPVQLVDQFASAAAFNSGRTEVYSGGLGPVRATIEKGDARILLVCDELDIPSLTVFSARGDVIRDEAKAPAVAEFLGRVRQHWDWFPANLTAVEDIYTQKVKQTPNDAKFFAANAASRFFPLNADLIRREQRIADVLFESGDIPRKIRVDVEFSQKFNNATNPAA
jgi:sulfonate transport system substrate-binding protein